MKDYIVTVMAQDRVGIVCDVSRALFELDGNITHLSQTVMRGYFTLIISVEMPDERTLSEIRQAVEQNGKLGEFEVNVRPYEETTEYVDRCHEKFTLSMQGKDQKGIIARAASYLFEHGINIDDFYSYVHEDILLMLAQVSLPKDTDVEKVQYELAKVGKEFGLVVHLQHEDIFRATSEIRPVIQIQRTQK